MVRVMLFPLGTVVAGVNTSMGCMTAPATPPEVMEVKMIWVNIPPDGAPPDATVSASVCTVMPVALPAVAAPIVTPLRVRMKVVAAGMPASLVEMTICIAVGADENAIINATEAVPAALFAGVAVVATKPDG